MRRFYSRLASLEEKRNLRKAFFYVFLSILGIVLLVAFGIPSLAKLAGFLANLKSSNQPIEKTDTTPPAPPRLETLPEATSKQSLEIKGTAEEGASVKLFINSGEEQVVADKDGQFTFTASLKKGENTVSAVAKDPAGNESISSEKLLIIYDNEEPSLQIISPEDGKNFYGSSQRQIVIDGQTEAGARVTINDRTVVVEEDGSFAYATTLLEGDNNFRIKTEDKAGNRKEQGITVIFWK